MNMINKIEEDTTMSEYSEMSKKELVVIAKSVEIKGYSSMNKSELIHELEEFDRIDEVEDEVEEEVEEETPLRCENYVYTSPYRQRHYTVIGKNKEVYDKLPNQAKKIFDYMSDTEIVATGPNIVKGAIEKGYVKTVQEPAVLYAFYARRLEEAGVSIA